MPEPDRQNPVKGGTLYLVATPLGNVGDMSPRAAEILNSVDYIAAEDTRRAARLLSSLGIGNRLVSYYEQNKEYRHGMLLGDLRAGRTIALISDAGMPCISDPGEALVRLAVRHGIPVSVIPGPSALLSALAASGLDTARFAYEGFLPVKGKERRTRLEALALEGRTLVFYEAPHRIRKTLSDLAAAGLEPRRLVIARELTKAYEEFIYFTVGEAGPYYETVQPRGEFTLVIEGLDEFRVRTGQKTENEWPEEKLKALLDEALAKGLKTGEAAMEIAIRTGVGRNRLYQLALELDPNQPKTAQSVKGPDG
ncbi:MAG TPA: 16S rRNA (cytidine(1402)-2'-O)-methyltransferase [Bacillota bacterium]|nr:16S rRNA (cytidine(1402)-2'-O)-methyltransferase [Fastidiosipila sp.]HPX93433.1 16S rRNA (cytidine(1402)-2'-O)-methyltransferase [Bacillota bacterium]HQB81205.1 16S rRNA (cytidine(1402)-2'-O)-methyltransferase [Bacillota bacterium]